MAHDIIQPSFSRQDERGTLHELMNSGIWQSIITGEMKSGAIMGNHYHKETEVFFFLFSGALDAITEHVDTKSQDQFSLKAMQGVILNTNESHKLTFTEPSHYLLLKSKPYDPENPDTYHYDVIVKDAT